jgi:hypothetical protein
MLRAKDLKGRLDDTYTNRVRCSRKAIADTIVWGPWYGRSDQNMLLGVFASMLGI